MAVDHALALELRPGQAVLRLYGWEQATVSFGRNQPARGHYDGDAAQSAGFPFVRRPTGGRAVLHDRELTYSVVAHAAELGGPRAAYRSIHEALRAGLCALGVPAELTPPGGPAGGLDTSPCFAAPAPGEIHVGGRKLVGSAQARFRSVILQHGSILTVNDQRFLEELGAPASNTAPGLTLQALGAPTATDVVADVIEAGFVERLSGRKRPDDLTDAEEKRVGELEGHYQSSEWTWRR